MLNTSRNDMYIMYVIMIIRTTHADILRQSLLIMDTGHHALG